MTEDDTLENDVVEVDLEIRNEHGLHMRPAMRFVEMASRFESDITVRSGETTIDGKSIMQITTLAATCGTKLTVKAEGPDAREAIEALRGLVEAEDFDGSMS
jgi:phosphotransferase system HPr (HPr) family protein